MADADSRLDWLERLRRVEDLGYSSVVMPDHFSHQLSPVPALMVAAENSNLRVGSLVLANDYRHPVILAKEAATIDILSEGRLEVGVGAGWMRSDYEESGIAYDPPPVRMSRFEEGLSVLKGAWGEGPFSFDGHHYKVKNYDGFPKPVQKPHPPILIGGGGKRVLSIAAREADIIGINPNHAPGAFDEQVKRDSTAQRADRKLRWIREQAGDRFADIEFSVLTYVVAVTRRRRRVAKERAPLYFLSRDEFRELPYALVGTVRQICDAVEYRRERWALSYFVVSESVMEEFAPVVERLRGN